MSEHYSLVVDRIREQIEQGFDYCCDTCPVGTLEQLLTLAEVAEAAKKLDAELAEAHSGFDSDGIYERYHRYPSEQRFRDALARLGE